MSFFENLPVLPYPFSKTPRPSLPLKRAPPLIRSSPLREEEENRPTRCSEPLRSKVGGPSKVFAMVVRDGTALLVVSVNRYYRCLSNVYNGV